MRVGRFQFIVVLVIIAHLTFRGDAVERAAFEAALNRWSSTEESFYKKYQAGDSYPAVSGLTRRAAIAKPRVTLPPTSTHDDSDSDADAVAFPPPTTTSKAPQSTTAARRWRPLPPPPTPVPVVVEEDLPTAAADQTKPRSFSETCSEDSSNLCNEVNPFNATFCLVSKKYSLSNDCRDYVTAKVNCYLSTEKLCAGVESHLRCLYQHRYHNALPRVCTGTRFFEYIRSGISLKDVLLDQGISTS